MPGIPVTEPLNPSHWEAVEQAIHNELVKVLGIRLGIDLPNMSADELTQLMRDIVTEMQSRPGAVTRGVEETLFNGDEIYQLKAFQCPNIS